MQTTNLLLQSGQEAQGCSPRQVDQLEPLRCACFAQPLQLKLWCEAQRAETLLIAKCNKAAQ